MEANETPNRSNMCAPLLRAIFSFARALIRSHCLHWRNLLAVCFTSQLNPFYPDPHTHNPPRPFLSLDRTFAKILPKLICFDGVKLICLPNRGTLCISYSLPPSQFTSLFHVFHFNLYENTRYRSISLSHITPL